MSQSHYKIMVVDDEVDLTQLIGFQFKSKGFEVMTASNGAEALEAVHGFKPDLIILDMNMPRMGGIEFFSKICGPGGKPLYPVLVLTARANVRELFKDLAIDGFMIKPFDIDNLVREAELIIRKRSQQAAQTEDGVKRPRHVCICDQHEDVARAMACAFLDAGFTVSVAKSGAAALERMMQEVPDVAAVHLGLGDIPGDTVIFRLSQMAKTMNIKFVLYVARSGEHDPKVLGRIKAKTGVWTFVEYDKLSDVLDAA